MCGLGDIPRTPYRPRVRNGAISHRARLLAAVSELDAVPAPATEVAAGRLLSVIEALIPGDISKVYLGEEMGYYNVPPSGGRRIAELPRRGPPTRGIASTLWSPSTT
jgi:hypothetical protein